MANDEEPTWGGVPPTPSRGGAPIPNQRSMPVTGSRPQPAPPAYGYGQSAHSDYQQQAAQHFNTQSPPQVPPVVPYPTAGSPAGYPAVPPLHYPPPSGGSQTYPGYARPAAQDSFIIRLMEKGVQGGLLRQPWFYDQRQRNPDAFVYVSFGVGVVLSIMLSLIPSSFVVTVLTLALWVGVGYLYLALGTRLAHQFLLFGICLVGGLVMAIRVLGAIIGLSRSFYYYEPPAVLMVVLLINLAGVGAAIYVGLQVHRGIQRMSQP